MFNSTKYYAYIWDSKHHTGTTGVGQWSTGVSCVNTSYANYVRVDKWNGSKWQNIHYSADDSYDIALTTDNNGSYVYNGVRYNIVNGRAYRV